VTNTGDDGRSSGSSNNQSDRGRGRNFSKSKKRGNRNRFSGRKRDEKTPFKAKSSGRRNDGAGRRGSRPDQSKQPEHSKIYRGNDGYGNVNGMPKALNAPRRSFNDDGRPDKFELFCAFYLGITEKGTYRMQGLGEIARRYGCKPDEILQVLKYYGIDKDTVKNCGLDLSLALLDIKVAPEGVDKWELARPWYDEFIEVTGESSTPESDSENGGASETNGSDKVPR